MNDDKAFFQPWDLKVIKGQDSVFLLRVQTVQDGVETPVDMNGGTFLMRLYFSNSTETVEVPGIALTDADDRNEIRISIPHDMTFPGRIGRHEVFWIDTDPETGEQTRTLLAWGHLTILEAGYGRPGD